jgi:Fungal specific transcription factor domain
MVMADQALDTPSLCQLPLHQPSHSGALEQLFSSHFIRSFGSARHTPPYWLERLPDMLVSSVSETVKDSIRAAVILFYGILTSNVPMQTEANRFYAKALHGLRSRLQNETRSIGDCSTNTSTTLATDCTWVCAPIMMCYFEMMANSSPDGWISHIEAAASMLESRGPEDCRLGMRHQIFLTVRLFMVRCHSLIIHSFS